MSGSSKAPADREGVHASGWTPTRVAVLFAVGAVLLFRLAGGIEHMSEAVTYWAAGAMCLVVAGQAARDSGRLARVRADARRAGRADSEGVHE